MNSIAEIEKAVTGLTSEEFIKFERWFDEERNRKWNQQLEADSGSGALDFLLKEVDEDIANGRTCPADEILDDPKG